LEAHVTARHRADRATRPRRLAAAVASGAVAFLLLVAGLLAAPLSAQASAAGMVRLAQLTPELQGVELVVSSIADARQSVMVAALGYGELSGYQALEPGDYVISLRTPGSTEPPMISRTLAVRSGASYTVGAISAKADDGLAVFDDDLTPPDPTRTRMRVINAAPPAPELDVRDAAGQALALRLPRGQAGDYMTVAPGSTVLSVGPPGGPAVEVPVTLAANQVVSVVLTGGDGGVRGKVVVDAQGPAVVPPGPVHAGFGGAAGDGPARAVGSVVLMVLAAGAALVSVRLARRSG
jgi:Domain of unknown function (DUF4397)